MIYHQALSQIKALFQILSIGILFVYGRIFANNTVQYQSDDFCMAKKTLLKNLKKEESILKSLAI